MVRVLVAHPIPPLRPKKRKNLVELKAIVSTLGFAFAGINKTSKRRTDT